MTCSLNTISAAAPSQAISAGFVAIPATGDPLVWLIETYAAACAYFNEHVPDNDEAADELAKVTYAPHWHRLTREPPAPTTFNGALLGLELIHKERAGLEMLDLMRLCIDFLKRTRMS